jgi:hypothetical protein
MCFFECIYGTSPESFIWEASDLKRLVNSLNVFLKQLREQWRQLSNDLTDSGAEGIENKGRVSRTKPKHSMGLQPNSMLLEVVSRRPPAEAEINEQIKLEMVFQLTCCLTLVMIVMDFARDLLHLQAYMDALHKSIEDLKLGGQSCNNAMWQIQVNDHSTAHSKRIWRAASFVWVMKHCSYAVQSALKEWLLDFLIGNAVTEEYRLDPFHFSYANK